MIDELEQAERERDEALEREGQARRYLHAAEAKADKLAEALRQALDCRGPCEGTVSERGGNPAVCTMCEDVLREALAEWEQG